MPRHESSFTHYAKTLFSPLSLLTSLIIMNSAFAADLKGVIKTADGTPICALAIASGRSMFTCSPPTGAFSFTNLPLEANGTITLQAYADGFYPNVTNLSDFSPRQVVLKPAQICDGGGGALHQQAADREDDW